MYPSDLSNSGTPPLALALLRETIGKVPHSAPVLPARRDAVAPKEKGPAEAEPDLPAASRQKLTSSKT
jgi:hypothetical protein